MSTDADNRGRRQNPRGTSSIPQQQPKGKLRPMEPRGDIPPLSIGEPMIAFEQTAGGAGPSSTNNSHTIPTERIAHRTGGQKTNISNTMSYTPLPTSQRSKEALRRTPSISTGSLLDLQQRITSLDEFFEGLEHPGDPVKAWNDIAEERAQLAEERAQLELDRERLEDQKKIASLDEFFNSGEDLAGAWKQIEDERAQLAEMRETLELDREYHDHRERLLARKWGELRHLVSEYRKEYHEFEVTREAFQWETVGPFQHTTSDLIQKMGGYPEAAGPTAAACGDAGPSGQVSGARSMESSEDRPGRSKEGSGSNYHQL